MTSTESMTSTEPFLPKDKETAEAFATSWNNLPEGSVYTTEQFEEWLAPLGRFDAEGKRVLELGCGNGSLLAHLPNWHPAFIQGVDLGDSVLSCEKNMRRTGFENFSVTQGDLTTFDSGGTFDLVYSIGVLHHLKDPFEGFKSMVQNTRPGGRFHGWVYAEEGNGVVMALVEPIRKVASRLPWWFTKYLVATPIATPFYIYAKLVSLSKSCKNLPLYDYSVWIARREFAFFRHVAFDQLVTPQTAYISEATIREWFDRIEDQIDPSSIYTIFRNGNSWKFGGKRKAANEK